MFGKMQNLVNQQTDVRNFYDTEKIDVMVLCGFYIAVLPQEGVIIRPNYR